MPGARCARSLACENKRAHEHSHHGHTGISRHSLRNGFTVSFVLSPVTGLVCHRRLRKLPLADLTPASGRQDHTTSPSTGRRRSSPTSPASIASRTQRRDDAQRPSWWARDRRNLSLIWGSDQGCLPAANWHDGQITPSVWRQHRRCQPASYAARRISSASARYDKASARWSLVIFSAPSRSASVRATRSTRW